MSLLGVVTVPEQAATLQMDTWVTVKAVKVAKSVSVLTLLSLT